MTSSPTPAVLPDARALWTFNEDTRDIQCGNAPVFRVYEADDFPCIEPEDRAQEQAWFDAQAQTVVLMLNSLLHDSADDAPIATPPASDAAVPAGFVLVPVEPTDEMTSAFANELMAQNANLGWEPTAVYKAMLAAAPKVASDTGEGQRPGEWDHRYRPLKHGEIIAATDECRRDDGTWVMGVCVGQPAPDPAYTSHRVYRRLIAAASDIGAGLDDGPRYLIRKGGAYYRKNSQGYTHHREAAGRYRLEEAIAITHPNGPDGPRDGMDYLLDTAPKVASDTGAGLGERNLEAQRQTIEACANVVRRIRDEYASRVRQTSGEHNEDADAVIVAAKIETAVRALRPNAALATPTDATDGATGGGEVPTGVPSQVPSSASHDDDEHGDIVTIAYMMGAKDERDRHAKATTPGGDLLEQAARVAESWQDPAFATNHENRIARSIATAIRALKPAGDGGEA